MKLLLNSRHASFIVALMVMLVVPAVRAQAPVAAPAKPHLISEYNLPGLDKKVSLDLLDSMDITDLLKFLATKANLNIIIGKEVTGSSKLMVKDVTLAEALEIVMAANGLAYEVRGNIVKVMTDKEYRDLYGEGFYERKQAKIIELKSAVPSRMAALLAEVKSSAGKIVFDDTTGNLVLIDTPEKIMEMEQVIRKAEIPTYQRVYPTVTTNFVLQYAKVEDLEPQITAMLTKDNGIGTLRSDKRTKTLVITDFPNVLQRICDVVGIFDRPQKQVFIEAKIVQVQLTDTFQMGVNWEYLFQGLDPRFSLKPVVKTFSETDITRGLKSGAGAGVTYHTIAAGADLTAVVEALSTVGKTKLLQNPHIATMDGKEAMIKAITTQPYSELQYESGSSNIVGKTYKFVDVGVSLGVTPRINELGFITCDIRPEVSSVLRWYNSDPSDLTGNTGVPVVKKSFAETSISVKDGVTIIIAGMIDERKVKERTQIPILGSIPLLGVLFRYDSVSSVNSETIVLLTPRIVTGDKFFERSKDMKKPVKGAPDAPGVAASDLLQ
ncbi:MAG: secretin N-terminal domain-containing protein [bacterium]